MCKIGDIILVRNYISQGTDLRNHSFIVLSTEKGKIEGLNYDMVCNVMSSFHDESHKRRKLSYPGNIPITSSDSRIEFGHETRDGYVKAEQLYFFDKSKLDFDIIGNVTEEIMKIIKQFIEAHPELLEAIIDNIK